MERMSPGGIRKISNFKSSFSGFCILSATETRHFKGYFQTACPTTARSWESVDTRRPANISVIWRKQSKRMLVRDFQEKSMQQNFTSEFQQDIFEIVNVILEGLRWSQRSVQRQFMQYWMLPFPHIHHIPVLKRLLIEVRTAPKSESVRRHSYDFLHTVFLSLIDYMRRNGECFKYSSEVTYSSYERTPQCRSTYWIIDFTFLPFVYIP